MKVQELHKAYADGRRYFSEADLSGVDLSGADLSDANLSVANLFGASFKRANLEGTDLSGADLSYANLSGAYLYGAYLYEANLSGANFSGVDLSGVNLSGVDLSGADLKQVKGIASNEEEMTEAKRILGLLDIQENNLKMSSWHTCETAHCLAGWSEPDLEYPGSKASRKMPTLAKYFYASNEEAYQALVRVANGEESIYN